MGASKETFIIKTFSISSLCISLFLSVLLFLQCIPWEKKGIALWSVWSGFFLLLVLISWFLVPILSSRGKRANIFLSIGLINLFIAVPELSLRVIGFEYNSNSGIQFGYPNPKQFLKFAADKDLFWKCSPKDPGINSDGFKEKEFSPKKPGTYRIIFLGDSCTFQGYPKFVQTFLNANQNNSKPVECLSLAVAGYSSYQGLIAAKKYGSQLDPDAVVVFFGWNDHWKAYGAIDSKKVIDTTQKPSRIKMLIDDFRLFQLFNRVLKTQRPKPLSDLRVPPEDYKSNLTEIGELFKKKKAPVIFLTAPTFFYKWGVPKGLFKLQSLDSSEQLIRLHKQYNSIVREVASGDGFYLVDLESDLGEFENMYDIFVFDSIHFTSEGLALVANKVTDVIAGLL